MRAGSRFLGPRLRHLGLLAPLALAGCLTIEFPGGSIRPLMETVVGGDESATAKVLLLEIDGAISESPEASGLLGTWQEGMVGRVREELDRARGDDAVRAVLLRINSPGGTVTGSDLLYQEVLRFKQERGVPVVAQLMGIAASGGYYVALAADEIHAQPTTVTGSIGVIFSGVNLTGLMEKIGVENQTLTSGDFKDAGSLLRPMRPAERAQLQSVLDDMYERFLDVVRAGRSDLAEEDLLQVADGRIFSAPQALALGLVDRVGTMDDALERLHQRAGLRRARVVTYHRPREYTHNLYTRPPFQRGLELDLWPEAAGAALSGPAFLYLWAPGLGLP